MTLIGQLRERLRSKATLDTHPRSEVARPRASDSGQRTRTRQRSSATAPGEIAAGVDEHASEAGQSVSIEPKNARQKEEAARALGRLLSGLEHHQRHQTKVLRFLEPIPDLSDIATELRRDAARLLEAAGDSREHHRTVERRVEAGLSALGERQTALEGELARLQNAVESLCEPVRAWGTSTEHSRTAMRMVHDQVERVDESLGQLRRRVEEHDTLVCRRLERQNRVLIGVGLFLGVIAILGLIV